MFVCRTKCDIRLPADEFNAKLPLPMQAPTWLYNSSMM